MTEEEANIGGGTLRECCGDPDPIRTMTGEYQCRSCGSYLEPLHEESGV